MDPQCTTTARNKETGEPPHSVYFYSVELVGQNPRWEAEGADKADIGLHR